MWACFQPSWWRWTISRRPWTVSRALPWDTRTSGLEWALDKPHPIRRFSFVQPGSPLPTSRPGTASRREIDLYSVTEVDRLMVEIGEQWRPIPLLAADTGLRWGELMGIEVQDFTHAYTVLRVRRTITEISTKDTGRRSPYAIKERTKSGRARTVMLGSEAAEMVRMLVEALDLGTRDRLFSPLGPDCRPVRTDEWPNGLPIGRSYFREYVWKPAHERAGVRPRRFHDLRGCHITWMLTGGADLMTVMTLAGHQQVSTTQLYLGAMNDSVLRGRRALEATRDGARKDGASDGVEQ